MTQTLLYPAQLTWEGRPSDDYEAYGRTYRLRFATKHDIVGTADPLFLGDPGLHNPEDLFVSSVAACHMLTYLALAARHRLGVTGYEDRPEGELRLDGGEGHLHTIRLRPRVTVLDASNADRAASLHEQAHARCFVARACAASIDIQPSVEVGPNRRPEDPDASLRDVAVELDDRPGALATFGETLGAAGVSVEGGGAWAVDGLGRAHFLVRDGDAAVVALRKAGLNPALPRPVLIVRLLQGVPGQLGGLTRALAEAEVNIEVLYSDHDHRLVLVVDDPERGAEVCRGWRTAAPAT